MKKLLIIFCFILISSCSFVPLNSAYQGEEYQEILSEVKFLNLKTEYDYLLKKYLRDEFNPENLASSKKYGMSVSVNSSIDDLLVQQDSIITRQEVRFNVEFSISDINTHKILSKGSFPIAISYAETDSLYSTHINKEYSYKIGLKEISRQLRLRALLALTKQRLDESTTKRN